MRKERRKGVQAKEKGSFSKEGVQEKEVLG
jgi:hypothetical protein